MASIESRSDKRNSRDFVETLLEVSYNNIYQVYCLRQYAVIMELMVRQSLSGQAPVYLADDCCLVSDSSLYGRLTFRLALYHEHTAAMATERLQPLDLVCGTLPVQLRNQTSPTNCSGNS